MRTPPRTRGSGPELTESAHSTPEDLELRDGYCAQRARGNEYLDPCGRLAAGDIPLRVLVLRGEMRGAGSPG